MVKHRVKPNVASYHSVIDELYKGQRVSKIAKIVETLLSKKLENPITLGLFKVGLFGEALCYQKTMVAF